MSENLDQLFVANREFVMFFHDRKNDVRIEGTSFMKPAKAVVSACQWSAFVIGPSNPSKPVKACAVSNAWEVAPAGGMDWTCHCPGVPNPNAPAIRMGKISSVSFSKVAYSYYDILTGNSAVAPKIGDECVADRTVSGRAPNCAPDWLGEAPNKYVMCDTWTIQCTAN